MSTGERRRHRTTLVKNKHELLEGRTVIDITDERLAHRRREEFQATLGHLSSIHQAEAPVEHGRLSRLWRRLTGHGSH